MTTTPISDHQSAALKRLISQYRNKFNIKAILDIYTAKIQELENVFNSLVTERTLNGSVGIQLDNLGTIFNTPRNGLTDEQYRQRIIGKIAENTSEGTPKDIINLFKILMQASEIDYRELYPATIEMVAQNPAPVADTSGIIAALNNAKPAGVKILDLIFSGKDPVFAYLGDPDTNTGGYRSHDGVETDVSETLNPDAGFYATIL